MVPDFVVRDEQTLRDIYGTPHDASIAKQIDYLHPLYQAFVHAAPFVVLATSGYDMLDVSPRGDAPGFVMVDDERTLLIPDRRGNNRIDSMRNLMHDPRIALIFLIPGINETLRVNGTASVSIDPGLVARFPVDGKLPKTVIVVHVTAVFFQCAKALMRSGLWRPESQISRADLPSNGAILSALTQARIDAAEFDRTAPAKLAASLY